MRRNGFLSVGAFLLLAMGVIAGQASPAESGGESSISVYRWVDESGRVQFGDKPPEAARSLEPVDVSPNVIDFPTPAVPPRTSGASSSKPASTGPISAGSTTDSRCEGYRLRLKHLRSRMRAGYAPSASNQLHDQERRLKDFISEYC